MKILIPLNEYVLSKLIKILLKGSTKIKINNCPLKISK